MTLRLGLVALVASHAATGAAIAQTADLPPLSARQAQDSDSLRRLAVTQAASGQLDQALATIDRAADLSPHDLDIKLARANILLWNGQHSAARGQGDEVRRVAPAYPELDGFFTALGNAGNARALHLNAGSVSAGWSRATFASGAAQTWIRQEATIGMAAAPRLGLVAGIEREKRDRIDTRIWLEAHRRIDSGHLYLRAGVTPAADFRESWSLAAGGQHTLSEDVDALLDLRVGHYRSVDVLVVQPGMRIGIGDDFSLTGRAINLLGGGRSYRLGGAINLAYSPQGQPGFFTTAASYPDTEIDGTRQLRSLAVGAIVPLGRTLTLRATGEHERRAGSYRRHALTLGMGWRFGGS
ncbi:MAG: YaiO family outer membrane beta-barrel protein [Novosphingobium sp.]|nr:YaiO family outer membrane beta-barrel protein [Novosphingobium sp.]